MIVTTDDLKKDVDMLLDDLKRNYEIPSILNTFRFLSKIIAAAFVVQLFLSALDFFIWGEGYRGGIMEAIAVYCIGFFGVFLLPSFVLLIVCHNPVMMMFCLSENTRRKSVLLNLAKIKLKYVFYFAIVMNLFVGVCLALNESAMIAFMGGSWFVTVLISTFIFNMMMAPYFTPAVLSCLSKVNELLSASPK